MGFICAGQASFLCCEPDLLREQANRYSERNPRKGQHASAPTNTFKPPEKLSMAFPAVSARAAAEATCSRWASCDPSSSGQLQQQRQCLGDTELALDPPPLQPTSLIGRLDRCLLPVRCAPPEILYQSMEYCWAKPRPGINRMKNGMKFFISTPFCAQDVHRRFQSSIRSARISFCCFNVWISASFAFASASVLDSNP